MKKQIRDKICQNVDQLIVFVREAAREGMVPQLQADDIINELLDARHAATAEAPVSVETAAAAA